MKQFKKLFKANKLQISLALTFSILGVLAAILLIDSINSAINSSESLSVFKVLNFFLMCVVLFFSIMMSQILFSRVGYKVVHRLRLDMIQRLLNTNLERVHSIGKAKIMAVLTKDVNTISATFMILPSIVFSVSIILGGFIYLAWISFEFFCVFFVVWLIAIIVARKMMDQARNYMYLERETDDRIYQVFRTVIDGQSEFKLNMHRRINFNKDDVLPSINNAKTYGYKTSEFIGVILGWADTFPLIGISCLITFHFVLGLGASEQLTAFALVVLFLRSPIANLMNAMPDLVMGRVAMDKVASLALSESTEQLAIPEIDIDKWHLLKMTQVQYNYPESGGELGFHFGPIDFHISRGELVFIIGGNGSGKSTFARLITGLYKPYSGSISIDNTLINESNVNAYRQHFSVVLSDFFLFERLLDNNGENPSLDKVNDYIQLFNLEKKIKIKNSLLNTKELSQGQKKRLALMAVYLEDKPIIILDEWAADQDPVFRKVFYRELLPDLQRQGKTIIAITHDDHYFDVADRVLKMENSRLVSIDIKLSMSV